MPESTVSKLAILEPGLRVYYQYADKFRAQDIPAADVKKIRVLP